MPRPMMTVAGERNRDGRCPLSASKTSPRGSLVRRDGVHRTACDAAETGSPRSRPLYTGLISGGFAGRSVDGRPAQETRQDPVDDLNHLAKVKVAGSKESRFRSQDCVL
jgi:hypothetical protein